MNALLRLKERLIWH